MEEKTKTAYSNFTECEKITLTTEQGSKFDIVLKVNESKTYKIDYYLNGKLLKPENMRGKNIAYKRWSNIISNIAENGVGFIELTPENTVLR